MTTHTHTTHNTHQQHKLTHNTQTTQQALNVGNGNELFWKQLTRIVCFGGAPTDNVGKDGIAQVEQAMGDNTWFHMFKEHTARLIFVMSLLPSSLFFLLLLTCSLSTACYAVYLVVLCVVCVVLFVLGMCKHLHKTDR
eukprot:TRINITY_DN1448_c0_g1_i2.p2 TRINITY_DN1448_c0_g1~~TRINITY_DN1448_c0_g1_i2.p2  ORF type:complete len:138 (-),score=30.01 TRINITY_DN1448_c0_g1_i2:185-598(-)